MRSKKQGERIRIPAKAGAWYLAVGGISKAVGVVFTPFFTRLLGENDYGEFARYMSLLGGASLILGAFTSGSVIYNGLAKNPERKGDYLFSSMALSIIVSLVLCLLSFAFSSFLSINALLLIPLALQLICDAVTAVMLGGERFSYRYTRVTIITLAGAILPPLLSAIWLKLFGGGFEIRVMLLLLVSFFIAAYSAMNLLKGKRGRPMIKAAFKNALPLLPSGISSAVTTQSDKLILCSMLGTAALAKYSVAYSIGISMQFIATTVGSALAPWVIRRLQSGEVKRIKELITPMIITYSAIGLCVVALAPEGMMILAPRDYLDALPALPPIAASLPLFFLNSVNTLIIHHSGRTSYPLIISVAGAASSLLLNYILVLSLGYIGGGLSLLISSALSLCLGLYFVRKSVPAMVIDIREMTFNIGVFFPVGWAMYSVYDNLPIRLFLLTIPAIMLLYSLYLILPQVIEKGGKSRP